MVYGVSACIKLGTKDPQSPKDHLNSEDAARDIWGFPKIGGSFIGVSIIRTIVFLALYIGVPLFGTTIYGNNGESSGKEKGTGNGNWVGIYTGNGQDTEPHAVMMARLDEA